MKKIDPRSELSTLGCTHNNLLQVLQRTELGPAPPKADPAYQNRLSNQRQIMCYLLIFVLNNIQNLNFIESTIRYLFE
jgi:hypothetical protein